MFYNFRSLEKYNMNTFYKSTPRFDSKHYTNIIFKIIKTVKNISYKFFHISFASLILFASCYTLILLFTPQDSYLENKKDKEEDKTIHDHYS
ncbi:hypothetical protein HANVADRAFT_55683 [Hanseniaspora valbyensis NRRL Y-1626]|uniref:Uncharacterized protein n=1 Tax=Hanseniaspora valbyensis NRRL Y-1626 TaxID=766949 RepID=A0A1B7TFL5_9ASCO|nr:hypothetical protein HANVADRAFT_55683 [Hanseniaspora valbyensis NRRL Y-1626]